MGKDTKKPAAWAVFLRGGLVALASYLGGLLLAALLLVRGLLPEGGTLPAVAGLCGAAAFAGGWTVGKRTALGALPASLLNTAIFLGVLVSAGLFFWGTAACWPVAVCALAGGLLAGLVNRRRSRKRKRGRVRSGSRSHL